MDAKAQATHEARITRALMKLGAARREKLDKLDFETFVEGLSQFDAGIVEQVCAELGRIAPEDYQPKFPPLHIVREHCHRSVDLARAHRLSLREPTPFEQFPTALSPERMAEIRRQVEAGIRRHAMRSSQ